jgi:hypothetical protein
MKVFENVNSCTKKWNVMYNSAWEHVCGEIVMEKDKGGWGLRAWQVHKVAAALAL